jgi:chemotaxis protein methyltransferase CheR
MRLADEVYQQARALIARRLGLHFPEGCQTNLERGLLQACHAASVPRPETYLAWLTALPTTSREWRRLAGSLTVGETYFFRDRASLAVLEQHVLPSLIAAQRAIGILQLRMWSAGCATGEEPYSLAILLDRLLPDRSQWHVTILATDINLGALEAAQRGLYRAWSLRETPVWLRERYFCHRSAATFEVDPQIRQMVTFVPCNLADDDDLATVPNTSAVDVILCRHVLMYLTPEVQRAVVAQLQRALVPGGWLVVGAVEASVELLRPLVPVTFPGAILFRKAPTAVDILPGSLPPLPEGEILTGSGRLVPPAGDSLTPTFSPHCSARHGQERRFTPSPLAGEGWDGGGKAPYGAPLAFTPTRALPCQGGGDMGELSQQNVYRTLVTLSRGE